MLNFTLKKVNYHFQAMCKNMTEVVRLHFKLFLYKKKAKESTCELVWSARYISMKEVVLTYTFEWIEKYTISA